MIKVTLQIEHNKLDVENFGKDNEFFECELAIMPRIGESIFYRKDTDHYYNGKVIDVEHFIDEISKEPHQITITIEREY